MTNNPTIDGVTRDLIHRTLSALSEVGKIEPDYIYVNTVVRDLREVLGVPSVGRKAAKCGQCSAPSSDICNQNGCGFLESGNGEPEVAALQSTIARLEARIAELESGRDVVVAYRIQHPDGFWCTWGSGPVSEGDLQDVADGVISGIEFAYAAPPAPAAVVLPERRPEVESEDPAILMAVASWNACLDATAALSGPAK